MAEVIGIVSASVTIAETTFKLSKKCMSLIKAYTECNQRVDIVVTETQRTHAILIQLHNLLREGGRKNTALNNKSAVFDIVLGAVEECRKAFEALKAELEKIVGALDPPPKSRLSLRSAKKLSWIFSDERIAELKADLAGSRQVVLLGLSLTQLSLQMRAPGVPLPLDEEQAMEAYADALVPVVLKRLAPPEVVVPGPRKPAPVPSPSKSGFQTTIYVPGDDRGPSSMGSSGGRERLDRIPKASVDTRRLDELGIRWLNDPFLDGYITIYEDLSDADLRNITREEKAFGRLLGSESRTYELELPDVTRKHGREHAMLMEEQKLRAEMAEKMKKEYEGRNSRPPASIPVVQQDPYEDRVRSLLRDWTIPTVRTKATPCGYQMKEGESIYKCETCARDDDAVLCGLCFFNTNHKGHKYKRRSAERGERSYCDCGDEEFWKKPVVCSHSAPEDW